MATHPEYRHQDIAVPARGTKVRTVRAGKHLVRIAFPKGARKKGSGQLISILHPLHEKNPSCGGVLSIAAADLAQLQIPVDSVGNGFGGGVEDALEGTYADANPSDWREIWSKFKSKVESLLQPHERNPRRRAKKNLDEIGGAEKLAEEFKGSPVDAIHEIDISNKRRDDYAHLGWACELVFQPPFDHTPLVQKQVAEKFAEIYGRKGTKNTINAWRTLAEEMEITLLIYDLTGDEIELCSSADGKQLYFIGGNQAGFADFLGDFEQPTDHDTVDLGNIVSASYEAQKTQLGDTEEKPYYHVFGEDGGTAPRGSYDNLNKQICMSGGTYRMNEAARGIIN